MVSWLDLAKKQQEVIDSATEAVSTTKKTQVKLEQQMDYADTAVSVHNVDLEAHPDIREQMSRFFDDPTISGPSAVESGVEGTWQLHATPRNNLAKLEKFYVDLMDGTRLTVPANPDGPSNFTHAFTGADNTSVTFAVMAYGSGFFSGKTSKTVLLSKHAPPDMSKMVCNLPKIVNANTTHTFTFNGITDKDGDLKTVDVESSSEHITLSQSADVKPDTEYTITVSPDLTKPEDVSITFTATDEAGMKSTRSYVVHINGIPDVDRFFHTIPNRLNPKTMVIGRFSGIIDPDGPTENITLKLECDNDKITFGKANGVKLNEDVNVIVGEVDPGTTVTFTVTATDKDGASATVTFTASINHAPDATGLTTNLSDFMYPGQAQTDVTFSGVTDADQDVVTYSLETDYPKYITFSKAYNIAENEEVTVTATDQAVRGKTYSIRIIATDSSLVSVKTSRDIHINQKVSPADITYVCEGMVKCMEPGKSYTMELSPKEDADKQTLKFKLTEETGKLTFTEVESNKFSFTAPSEADAPRGTKFKVKVVADDGYEPVEHEFDFAQNQLPDIANFQLETTRYLTAGISNNATVKGVTDPDDTKVTFHVSCSNASITFPVNNTLEPDNPFVIEVGPDVAAGSEVTFTFTFKDEDGGTKVHQTTATINTPPVIDGMTLEGLPTHVAPGQAYELTVKGATDPNSEGITYVIQNPAEGLTFSKVGQIAEGEKITMTVGDTVTRGDALTFVLGAVDPSNATTGRTYTVKVNRIPKESTAIDWIPDFRHNDTFTWITDETPFTDEDGQNITYNVTCDNTDIKFYTKDIEAAPEASRAKPKETVSEALDEIKDFVPTALKKFGFKIPDTIARGTAFKVSVTATDGVETWKGERNVRVKQLPTKFRTDKGIDMQGGFEHSQNIVFSWDDPDVKDGYDASLTTWTGFADKAGFKFGTLDTKYTSGQEARLIAPKVDTDIGKPLIVTVNVSDSISVVDVKHTINASLHPIPVTAPPRITYPTEGQEVPYEGYTITWTRAERMIDMDNEHPYPIGGDEP